MKKEKKATLDELRKFLEKRPSLTITQICKEAGIPERLWLYVLSNGPNRRCFTTFCEQTMREKLRPVMRNYGHKA